MGVISDSYAMTMSLSARRREAFEAMLTKAKTHQVTYYGTMFVHRRHGEYLRRRGKKGGYVTIKRFDEVCEGMSIRMSSSVYTRHRYFYADVVRVLWSSADAILFEGAIALRDVSPEFIEVFPAFDGTFYIGYDGEERMPEIDGTYLVFGDKRIRVGATDTLFRKRYYSDIDWLEVLRATLLGDDIAIDVTQSDAGVYVDTNAMTLELYEGEVSGRVFVGSGNEMLLVGDEDVARIRDVRTSFHMKLAAHEAVIVNEGNTHYVRCRDRIHEIIDWRSV